MKTCSKCGETKPTTEFPKRACARDGLNSWCKACKAERSAAHYIAHRDKVIEATKNWKMAHRVCTLCGSTDHMAKDCQMARKSGIDGVYYCQRGGKWPARESSRGQGAVQPGAYIKSCMG